LGAVAEKLTTLQNGIYQKKLPNHNFCGADNCYYRINGKGY
jgi:hypothetical protein